MRIEPNSGARPSINPRRALISGTETIAEFASKILNESGTLIHRAWEMTHKVSRHPPKGLKQTTKKADHIKPPTVG